jgi:hypothetical protein
VQWVTNITSAVGAPVDDVITCLLFTPDGTLYIGNPTALNVRFPNGTYIRYAGPDGLPYGNITSLALDERWDSTIAPRTQHRIWIGTTAGGILFDPEASSQYGQTRVLGGTRLRQTGKNADTGATGGDPLRPRWRYFYGPRYFPSAPGNVWAGGNISFTGIVSVANTTYLLGATGVTALQAIPWTLSEKAVWMESQLSTFDLYGQGLVGDCGLPSFGLYPCIPGPNDNNGLWTSLIVAAESFRYAVTSDSDASTTASHYLLGMKLLNDVTGIHGLIARSALPPGAPCPQGDPAWHNSTSLPGYCFKGTASSDEVVGHNMAYPIYADLVQGPLAQVATDLLVNLTRYIVVNNFTLVDVTGLPSQWGHWEPAYINVLPDWADDRGINSVEILGLISSALKYLPANGADAKLLTTGFNYLALQNDYYTNMINTRINAPVDLNYSDDELTFFAYMALFFTCRSPGAFQSYALSSIERSWATGVGDLRSNLWGAIYLAATGPYSTCNGASHTITPSPTSLQIGADIVWNLRTWSPDLLSWPAMNSQRQDIIFNTQMDRFGDFDDQSMSILPQYERCQDRWNANPYQLNDCNGNSMSDPGVWLYPYWLSKYLGIIA